jgi:alginate O-acetyltransferase complex protein AlgI
MQPELDRPIAPARLRAHPTALHQRYRIRLPQLDESGSTLYANEPETCQRSLRQFAPILLHLALLIVVTRVYHIEGRAFEILLYVATAALPIHYLLPFRFKKPFFIAASVVGLALVFGLSVTAIVLPVAVVLIGICYLPCSWLARAAMIGAISVLLALGRGRVLGASLDTLPPAVWPVLGSMFMFRMIIYLYELKHAKAREPLIDTISYFFLLPNYAFLLFPVVDYRTLRRSYFASDIHAIQRTGLRMMVRGVSHLLLYRVVYHQLLAKPEEIETPIGLLTFLVCNYLLYLRVSGQFHIACGLLHLFGYQLPETHHNYLLATGFTDYWRRINIYWKDFMVRVVFNPVAFRLKAWPHPIALAAATGVVFVVTWGLHAYQSFWLSGRWNFSRHDALFWGILGLLVLVNVQLDARRARARTLLSSECPSLRALALRIANTAGTFATIAFLWSLWTSASFSEWTEMLARAWR